MSRRSSNPNNDLAVSEAGDLFDRLHGRRGPSLRASRLSARGRASGGGGGATGANSSPAARANTVRAAASRLVSRSPEVVVKILGASKSMPAVRATARYISRGGDVALENDRGEQFAGPHAPRDALATWGHDGPGIPRRRADAHRREALHVALAMPAGTSTAGMPEAARTFAARTFGGHKYLVTPHADRNHPHLHILVASTGEDGRARLNPDKSELHRWRELFAEALREQGVEANATSRAVRGQVQRGRTFRPSEIDRAHVKGEADAPSRITSEAEREAREEVRTGIERPNPAASAIEARRSEVLSGFEVLARALDEGSAPDRTLATELRAFARALPSTERTAHRERVRAMGSESSGRGVER